MQIGTRSFDTKNKTYVMGILNVTPDSFSDGGKYNSVDRALAQAERMISEGADIIDIGGESTRPGYTMISDEEEISRAVPVIEAVKAHFDMPVSLDTYKSRVARAGMEAGADLINDIWGLKYDSEMGRLIAKYDVPCCLMHNREQADYGNFPEDLKSDLKETLRFAKAAGIRKEQIILDPGVGFAKSYENNLSAIRILPELRELGCPLLLGASRKSVIGLTLNVPSDGRVIGTAATTVYAAVCGCSFVRVHDVKENVQAIRMIEAVMNAE